MDGVDIKDNLFGDADNLLIEDAIEEVQVLTSGISAEYDRFSGGVVNVVTKSGGAAVWRPDHSQRFTGGDAIRHRPLLSRPGARRR